MNIEEALEAQDRAAERLQEWLDEQDRIAKEIADKIIRHMDKYSKAKDNKNA